MSIHDEKNKWLESVYKKAIDKLPERKEQFKTSYQKNIYPIYCPGNDASYFQKLGFPGEYPFTRGIQPTMYRGRLWTIRQYAGYGTAEESNKRYKYLLEQGQKGLSIAFDLPTQIGYDSDHPMSEGEVGKVGVAIDSLDDMEILFQGIPLEKISTSMTINSTAPILLAMYIAVGEKQGIDSAKLNGTVQNDILKEYIARGTYIFPPRPSMRLITDIFSFCGNRMPKWNTISISGYHIREAGANAVQEVAFTLADGIAYVEAALAAGLNIDAFAPNLSFFFNAHNNLFEEVAKFRAARRLWAKIMKDRFKAKDPRSMMLRFHTQTAGCSLTAQQPDNNIVRVTVQSLAAVLGGTQSLHTNSKDEALALPSENSVRIAVKTQQIIAHESGVSETIDPFAGSYYVETLTDEIETKAEEYLKSIHELGGMIAAIEKGYVQKEIQDSSFTYQKEIETKNRIIVGVNEFQIAESEPENLLRVDPEIQISQMNKLKKIKEKRDNDLVKRRLMEIKNAAQGKDNIMPSLIEAVRAYATLGEITDTLREVFGEYKEMVIL